MQALRYTRTTSACYWLVREMPFLDFHSGKFEHASIFYLLPSSREVFPDISLINMHPCMSANHSRRIISLLDAASKVPTGCQIFVHGCLSVCERGYSEKERRRQEHPK